MGDNRGWLRGVRPPRAVVPDAGNVGFDTGNITSTPRGFTKAPISFGASHERANQATFRAIRFTILSFLRTQVGEEPS